MGKDMIDEDIKEIVHLIRKLMIMSYALEDEDDQPSPPKQQNRRESDEEKEMREALMADRVAEAVLKGIKESGMTMDRASLQEPAMINKLGAAIVVAAVGKDDPGAEKTIGMLFAEPHQLSGKENTQLAVATEYTKAMAKDPNLKLDMSLIFKDPAEMSKEEKAQFQTELKAAMITNNPKMELKTLNNQAEAITKELEKPGATQEKLQEEKAAAKATAGNDHAASDKAAMKAQADFKENLFGGEGMLSVVPNALGIADDFPELNSSSPLANLAGSVFSPTQAATGEETLEADRDLEQGVVNEFDLDDAGETVSLDDVGMDLLSDTIETATDTATNKAETGIELDEIEPTFGAEPKPGAESTPGAEAKPYDVNEPSEFTEAVNQTFEDNNVQTYDSPSPSPGGGGG